MMQITHKPAVTTVEPQSEKLTAVNVFNDLDVCEPQSTAVWTQKNWPKSQLPQWFFLNFVPKLTNLCGTVNPHPARDIKGVATKAATLLFFYVPAPQVRSHATHPLTGASDCGSAVWAAA